MGSVPRNLKLRVFIACVTSVLLYGAESWKLTKVLEGCFTKLLRMVHNYSWKDKIRNDALTKCHTEEEAHGALWTSLSDDAFRVAVAAKL